MATLASLAVKLGIDPKEFTGGLAKARSSLRNFQDDVERSRKTVNTFGGALTSIGKIPTLVSLAGSAVALAGAVKPAAGALWLLPAAASVGAAAAGTLKVGLSGVSDAFKALASGDAEKAAEAMEKLAPAAQKFVRAGDQIRVKFDQIRKSVQGKMFEGLAWDLEELGMRYLPILDKGLGKTATSINGLAQEAAAWMDTPFMAGVAARVFDTTAKSLSAFKPAVGPVITGLGAVVQAGLPLVQQFSMWAGKSLAAKAAFLGTAEGATWLQQKITSGVAVMQQLLRIVGNLMTGLNNLFTAANAGGTTLLGTLEQMTARFAEWSASAQGQEQLKALFTALVNITNSLLIILPQVAGALGTLAAIFTSLPGPVQSVVGSFLAWSFLLGPIIGKMAPLIALLVRIGPTLLTAGMAVGRFSLTLGQLGIKAAQAAVKTGVAAAQMGARWAAMAATATANAVRIGAQWLLTAGPKAATAVAQMVAASAKIIARWAVMAAGAMARAAVMAASWIVAMGPVGWVIAAIVALVALIIANWDSIKAATIAAWNAVSAWVKNAWNVIVSTVSGWIAKAVAFVTNGWNQAKSFTANAWSSLVSTIGSWIDRAIAFVRSLPGKIVSALGNLGSLLVNSGRALVQGFLNGIKGMWNTLVGWVRQGMSTLRSLWPFSPAKEGPFSGSGYVDRSGKALTSDFAKSLRNGIPNVVGQARALMDAARGELVPQLSGVGDVQANYGDLIAEARSRTEDTAREQVVNVIVNNPRAERASDSIARELRDLSIMGAFAGRG